MGYVGNQTTTAFTSMDKQDITGNGGPNYTLSHAVANANEIEVFVNNVRQEPTVAYSASGTTLTMTGNVASSDDFYVVYQGKAVGTIVPPDGSVSTAKIADDAVTNAKIADDAVTLDKIADGLLGVDGITTSSSSGTAISIDSSNRVTTPSQPSFFAQWNAGGDASLSANTKVPASTMKHNVGNHYNTSEYRFYAPVAGIYLFCGQMWSKTNGNNARFSFRKNGSTRLAQLGGAGIANDTSQQGIVIVSLNANDYVEMWADDFSHNVHAGGVPHTYWAGHLLG